MSVGWGSVRGAAAAVERAWLALEANVLEPLMERFLWTTGDPRGALSQALGAAPVPESAELGERAINRGIYLSGVSLSMAVGARLLFPPLQILSLPGLVYGAWQLYREAYRTIRDERRLDINVLMALVNTAYILFGYWILGNLTVLSYYVSRKLLFVVRSRLQQTLIDSLHRQSGLVWVQLDGHAVQRCVDDLQVGDVVLINAGEVIPIDGIVCSGAAAVDEQMLTGEAHPVEKIAGERVFAATVLLTGKIGVSVTQTSMTAMAAKIEEVLAQTVDYRTTGQLRMQRLTDEMVVPTLGLAALTYPFFGAGAAAGIIENHPYRTLNNFAALSLLNALEFAAQKGIQIKDGRTFELLAAIDTVVFDKTGTLTQAVPSVRAIHTVGAVTAEQLLTYAATAEQHQSHPIARAILQAAADRSLRLPDLDDAAVQFGLGVAVSLAGCTIHVGSARYMEMAQMEISADLVARQEAGRAAGNSLVWVARDGQVVGAIELQAALRPEAAAVAAALRRCAKIDRVIVISGDGRPQTEGVAAAIGADAFYAEVLPDQKGALIADLQARGRSVCYVGDGINDAIALKQAHVSISLAGATMAAVNTAHVVLMAENLEGLPMVFSLAQRFARTQRLMVAPVFGTMVLGYTGIFLWGWGLPAITVLELIGNAGGIGVALSQRLFAYSQLLQLHSKGEGNLP